MLPSQDMRNKNLSASKVFFIFSHHIQITTKRAAKYLDGFKMRCVGPTMVGVLAPSATSSLTEINGTLLGGEVKCMHNCW